MLRREHFNNPVSRIRTYLILDWRRGRKEVEPIVLVHLTRKLNLVKAASRDIVSSTAGVNGGEDARA